MVSMSTSLSALEIRAAVHADREVATALLAQQLGEHAIVMPATDLAAAVEGILVRPERGRILLAFAGGQPIGVAVLSFVWTLEHGGRSAWLDELYVVETRRSQGVGLELLRAAEAEAARAGARAVDLEVETGHARAANLYARNGFRAHERRRWVKRLEPSESSPGMPGVRERDDTTALLAALPLGGGCLCGRCRYRVTALPVDAAYCHCRICQRAHGAPAIPWATFLRRDVAFSGAPARYRSSPQAERAFCGNCGTQLAFLPTSPEVETLDLAIVTLDDPSVLRPQFHIWTASHVDWFATDDGLPRFKDAGPDARPT